MSIEELTRRFNEMGWSIKPTLCPEHRVAKGQPAVPPDTQKPEQENAAPQTIHGTRGQP
ncbi:hypothetical protein ANMWB30_24410 [Arthrobacter sp. MWB30]|nr:hypothetical protein ANMWB30_24410 [Arthrobacter sp. MWB30]